MQFSAVFKKNNDKNKKPQKREKFIKLFTSCFKPGIVDVSVNFECDDQKGVKGKHVINYTLMEEKDMVVISPSLSSEVELNKEDGHVKKKGHGRICTFSYLWKVVFFRTSLAKKIDKKKHQRKMQRQGNENLPLMVEKESSLRNEKHFTIKRHHHGFSGTLDGGGSVSIPGSLMSSSCSSSHSSGSWWESFMALKQKSKDLQEENGKGLRGYNTGLCFILVILVFLVLWGKACAILCTSACFFLVPRRRTPLLDTWRHGVECKGIDLEEYKKKIIMEGMLDRNRHHRL